MHKFNPDDAHKLDSEERHKILSPDTILLQSGLTKGVVAADIGCGTGFFTIAAAEIVGDDGKIYAFDIEKKMLTFLRMKIEKPNIVPIHINEGVIPLKNKLLDYVLIAFVLHEVEHPENMIKEAKRILKHSGILTIIEWVKQTEKNGPSKEERLSQKKISSLLEENDFTIENSERLNSSHYVIIAKINQ